MKVFIDADGCPVVDETVDLCKKYAVECVIICDTAHVFNKIGVTTVVVEKGADSVDFKLVNMLSKGDIAVTQDYGLAAMCLARGAVPINQNGLIYNEKNIDELLFSRFVSKKIRRAGGRLKGPSKRTPEQDEKFIRTLENLLKSEN
ncbi:MAG: YaiI/YqxD family protein [Clostridia bacterium]|nr:YaiI/YqxD family protein [Clostridia bacterium]